MSQMTFLGDVFLPQASDARDLGFDNIVLNLEAPITKSPTPHPRKINLRVSDWFAEATFGVQPLAVCLANNHIMDFGPDGLQDTLQVLDSAGVAYFGAGALADACSNPALVRVGGAAVALLGYVCPTTAPVFASEDAPGVAPIDLDRIRGDIRRSRAMGAQRVIVSLHWGAEEVWLPRPYDVVIARRIIDLGADMIIGHHAHTAQAWEMHRGRPVFYGLGNFIMPDFRVPARFTDDGVATAVFRANQAPWNRRSLAVLYDPESGDFRVISTRYRRNVVARSSANVLPAKYLQDHSYASRFRLTYGAAKLRRTLYDGARRPRLPRWRHLRKLIRQMTTRDYR